MKKLKLICLFLAILLTLTACAAQEKPLPACDALGESILAGQTFTEEMLALSESKLVKALDLDADSYAQAYMSMDASRATPESVIVITAKDKATADKVAEKLEAYRADTLRQYQDYRPDEAPKLENAKVLRQGLQCVLAVCGDQAAVQQDCNTAWGK